MSRERIETLGLFSIGVDREAKLIRGVVAACKGPFKTPGRGEFDDSALRQIVTLMNAAPRGLKSHFTHPDLFDGLGTFLGRFKNARVDRDCVRADLHFDPTAFATPRGDLAGYVMRLAESDPDAFGCSLVLSAKKETRLDASRRPAVDAHGNLLPPLWRPTAIYALDTVDSGDSTNGFLGADVPLPRLKPILHPRGSRSSKRPHLDMCVRRYNQRLHEIEVRG